MRGEPIPWSNFGYVVLIAPAWLVTEAQSTAYALAKTINVGLGVLALVLVYFWARRLTTAGYAVLAAGLTALMPSLLYAGMLMSENGFLPAFLLAALATALALERPTLGRQALAFAAIGLACFIRVQGIVLLAVLPTAVLLAAVLEARVAPAGSRLRAALAVPERASGPPLQRSCCSRSRTWRSRSPRAGRSRPGWAATRSSPRLTTRSSMRPAGSSGISPTSRWRPACSRSPR